MGRYIERQPDIRMAGKSEYNRKETTEKCLEKFNETEVPSIVARHYRKTRPEPGAQTWNFNHTTGPRPGEAFGMCTVPDEHGVPLLLQPAQKSAFQEAVEDAMCATKRAPLGRSRNVKVLDPAPPVPTSTIFGIRNTFESSTAECMDVNKNLDISAELEQTAAAMYVVSHNAIEAGTQRNRQYTSAFEESKRYGKPSPHSKEGKAVRKTLHWVNEDHAEKRTPLISVAARDWEDRYGSQLGAPSEPLKDTRGLETTRDDHIYGSTPADVDEDVAALFELGMGAPILREEDDKERMLITRLAATSFAEAGSHGLVTTCFERLPDLAVAEQSLVDLDIQQSERITGLMERAEVERILVANGLEVAAQHLPDKKLINYRALLTELKKGQLKRTNPLALTVTTKDVAACGHSTIRHDVAKKVLKKVTERRNLGDEGGVDTILNPSPATRRGLDDDAFTMCRDKAFIQKLFTNAGISGIRFADVWAGAQGSDGQASIQSFQVSLEAISA